MDNHRLKIIAVLVTGLAAFAVAANSPYYGVKPDEMTGTAEGHISGKWGVAASSQTADSYTITLDGPTGKGTLYTVESGTVTANHVQTGTLQASTAAVNNALSVGQSATIGANANIGGNASVTGNISTQGNLSAQGTGNVTGAFTGSTGTFSNALGVGIAPTARFNVHNGNMVMTGVSLPFQFPSTTKTNLNLNTSFSDALGSWGGSSGGNPTINSGEYRFGGGSAFFQLYRGLRQSWTDTYKFNPTAEFTLTFWAKRLSDNDAFFFYWIGNPDEYRWFSFEWRYNNNSPYFTMHLRDWYSGTSTRQSTDATQLFTANTWHYIVLQYNHFSSRRTTVWIDGVRLACGGHTSTGGVPSFASGFINIGGMTDVRGWWGNDSLGFYGYMDEIRFDHVARYDYNAVNVPVPTMEWGTPTINTMLGIHTNNPQARLHIGNVDSKTDQILVEGGRHSLFNQSGGVGINVGAVEPNAKLDVVADAQYPYILRVSSTAQQNLPILSVSTGTWFVGIRKANPQAELDVNGTIKANLLSATTAQVSLLQSATVQAALAQVTTGQFSVMNATSAIQLNGTNINSAGTLGNVAYKNQDNNFTVPQTFHSSATVTDDFESTGTVKGRHAEFWEMTTLNDVSITGSNRILQFEDEDGSNAVAFRAPEALDGDPSFILPGADGTAGQSLTTDGAGNLSFGEPAGVKVYSGYTDDATQTEIFLNGTTAQFVLAPQSALEFSGYCVGQSTTNYYSGGYSFAGHIKRDGSDNTVLVSSSAVHVSEERPDWDVAVDADDDNEALRLQVIGEPEERVYWRCRLYFTELVLP